MLLVSLIWLSIVAVLLCKAWSQGRCFRRLSPAACPAPAPVVSVIVPARDEAANILPCMRSLLAQVYEPGAFEIVVVDDGSRDATPKLAKGLIDGSSSARLLSIGGPPSGWFGKPFACWVGACAARPDSHWLCFVDADVRASAEAVASALAEANRRNLDFLSVVPRQVLGSLAERLVIPCALYAMAFSGNVRRCEPEGEGVTASGPFMLVRRSSYFGVGGHKAVRGEICEDLALARLVKRRGARVATVGGNELLSCRMYRGFRSVWEGLSRNAVESAGDAISAVALALAALVLSWTAVILPTIAVARTIAAPGPTSALQLAVAATASLAVVAFHVAGARHFSMASWLGLLFPVGYTLAAGIALNSVRLRLLGRVLWRGRTLAVTSRNRPRHDRAR